MTAVAPATTSIPTTVHPEEETKVEDYLHEDPEISHQKYVCLSFISPEDAIKKKEIFFMDEFFKSMSKELNEIVDYIKREYPNEETTLTSIKERYEYFFNSDFSEQYKFFVNNNKQLESKYFEQNNFQTTIRGIKVRGSYETVPEAKNRAKNLNRQDPNHNVFIAQVGTWCPWSPNMDEIKEQEYANNQLNSLMGKYNENRDQVDEVFDARTKKMIDENKAKQHDKKKFVEMLEGEDAKKALEAAGMPVPDDLKEAVEAAKGIENKTPDNEIVGTFLEKKLDKKSDEKDEGTIKASMADHEKIDPWLARKQTETKVEEV